MDLKAATENERPDVILDLERLKNNCNGNVDIVRELLAHLYQRSGPKWFLGLQNAVVAGNTEEFREICHGMKGASATVFAWRISNLALEFERLARDGEIEKLRDRMPELQAAFDEFALWVKQCPELS
ncbi:HPt domain-containing protein [Desulfocapsa sulfexigens DSM 10523]|uniref:HPt domain-containing protein n=1 Tax=Desulfocapsa sulfexigens (strain DSM 10523 / SB164P1) TaxID=1167006 RepID=M1PEK5_DESSD|nr:Hpt domain-containing protein [Desulfocapsa sulfexigens]AGF78155.1 HPt domain-containing protein [Desulfocapsa sulfexigens DSM 10523]